MTGRALGPLFLLFLSQAWAEEARTLEAVTVTARSDSESEQFEAVSQKRIIDRAEIEALGGLTVNEVIRKLPGIDAGTPGGDGGPSANARGMGRDAVQFLVDGERPSANARYALTTVGRLPSGELERIEILRGASAEHGGASAITVNLIMRKAKPTASVSLKAAAGLRGEEENGQFSASFGGGDKDFSWVLPVSINRHGLPQEKTLARQSFANGAANLRQKEREEGAYTLEELVLSPRLTWRGDGRSLTLWPSLYHNQGERQSRVARLAGDPATGSVWLPDGGRQEVEESRMTILRLRAEGETRAAGGRLSGRAAVMDGRRHSSTDRLWQSGTGLLTGAEEVLDRDENEFSSAIRLDWSLGDGLFAAGLEQNWHQREERQRVSGGGGFSGRYEARSSQWSAWAQHEWLPVEALTLTAGLRGERIDLEADGVSRRAGQLAPSLAARWALNHAWVVRSSIGAGIKAPKLDEISALTVQGSGYNSPLEPDRAGNPDLEAERNLNWEASLEHSLPGEAGTLGANVYLRRTQDFIERRTTLEAGRWVERPYNEGRARHWGLELDAKLKPDAWGWKGAALRGHLTLPHGRVEDRRLGLSREARELPRYQLTLGLDQSLPFWQASAGLHLTRHGEVRTDIPGERRVRQGPRNLLDAYITRRLTAQLNLRLEAQNLLRADTRRHGAAWAGAEQWSLEGEERGQRSFMLSLEGKW